ncbi:MAG TPA: hypothetical protein PLS93_02615 [Accumulibacter sp.]|nr:hypothetical protein [Accumulibacter sp.]
MPLIAAETAQASHTPLPTVLAWRLPELFFWHAEFCELAGV